eukprot:Seg3562.7 transcript_id=Seg3562.7/GoldUCD/mRNA.D3Y31 product="hypothetical protein" protein_id=Seg3562.7/GoldUCD/D3Y31
MEVYSFEVLYELFQSTSFYEDYFPTLRGDAHRYDTIPFGFQELTVRNSVIILEVEKRIIYELLTRKLLTAHERLERCQSNRITMCDKEIVLKLSMYWRDKCIEKASAAKGSTAYWTMLNDKNSDEDIEETLERDMYTNTPHIMENTSKMLNGNGELDVVYKVSSRKQERIHQCQACGVKIKPTCYLCNITGEGQGDDIDIGYSLHRYAVNSSLFTSYYLFSIDIINKGTQLNRLKNSLKGVIVTKNGIINGTLAKSTTFRQLYLNNGYVILDVDLLEEQEPAEVLNWTIETLRRHKKTAATCRKRKCRRKNSQQQQQQSAQVDDEEEDIDNIISEQQTTYETIKKKRLLDYDYSSLDLSDLTSNILF